jgi:hypothetical protein
MRKAINFLFFVLLLCSFVSAVDTQISIGSNDLLILYPKVDVLKLNEDIDLHFHVFNSSGAIMDDAGTTCYVHVYNHSNAHVQKAALVRDGVDLEFKANTSALGRYAYNLWCNGSNGQWGFVSSTYDVTNSGLVEPDEGKLLPGLVALIPLFLALIFLIGAATLGEGHNVMRIFFFLLSPVFVIVSLQFATLSLVKFFDFPELQDAIGYFIYWAYIIWGVVVTYFIIYGIYIMIHTAAQKKKERLEY